MESLTKLKLFVPCAVRYLPMRFSSMKSDVKEPDKTEPHHVDAAYSRAGDSGYSLINNKSVAKDDRIFHAIGNTDELLCHLGVVRENALKNKHPYTDNLTRIQTMLVDIVIAISKDSGNVAFPERNTKELEEWILQYSKELTPAEKYLLPGGGKVATSLHVARSVCRRAERSVFPLIRDGRLDKEIEIYFNRLADLLFTWARYAAKRDERSESVYTPKSESKKKPADTKQETTEKVDNKSS